MAGRRAWVKTKNRATARLQNPEGIGRRRRVANCRMVFAGAHQSRLQRRGAVAGQPSWLHRWSNRGDERLPQIHPAAWDWRVSQTPRLAYAEAGLCAVRASQPAMVRARAIFPPFVARARTLSREPAKDSTPRRQDPPSRLLSATASGRQQVRTPDGRWSVSGPR
jgi:hypothetical protein